MSAGVEIIEDGGEFEARALETGVTGTGTIRAAALAALAIRLEATESDDAVLQTGLEEMSQRTRQRLNDHTIARATVGEAIESSRSE